jgi:NAD(P)-dependent dehydrogenase (short-subunit alcohol dehydrogenase family)
MGRVAFVSGGSRGIGRGIAEALARHGHTVAIGDIREAEPVGEGGIAVPLDVTDSASVAKAVERVTQELGPIEILVNNAGVGSAHERPIWEQDPSVWHETLAVNLHAPFHLTRLAAPDMVKRGWGRIVMVSSTAGQIGGAAESAYDTSKHGLLGLMRSVAQDVGSFGVTCNAVLPGWVHTSMAERSAAEVAAQRGVGVEEVWAERAAVYPAGRVVTVEEVAAAIVFLAGEEASGINGETITVALGGIW